MVVLRLSALAAASVLAAELALARPTDHHVARLFSRQSSAEIGSEEWKAQYPPGGTVPAPKQEWVDALHAVVSQGKIPDIPVATLAAGWPSYSDGVPPADPSRCHYTVGCIDPTDFIDAPDGYIGISQDDGPLPPGRELNAFFEAESISATHFYIGANVVSNYDIALQALGIKGQTLGVHTWTHGYSSGQTNEELVAEIGWTMQVLADINGGRIPSFWRPPFGDVDNRVRAIAREVFGLYTIIWNQMTALLRRCPRVSYDSEDWHLGTGGTIEMVQGLLQGFIDGPKSPGLLVLEHELYDGCVEAFKNVYPSMLSQGWKLSDIPDLWGFAHYKNALSGTSEVDDSVPIANTSAIVLGASSSAASSSSAVASSSSSSPSSASSLSRSASVTSRTSTALPSGSGAANDGSSAEQQSGNGTSAAAPAVRHSSLALALSLALVGLASLQ